MQKFIFVLFTLFLFTGLSAQQVTSKKVENITVSTSSVRLLGKSDQIRNLTKMEAITKEKKDLIKKNRATPENFKGRRCSSMAKNLDKEHQGSDQLRQTGFEQSKQVMEIELLVNIDGIGNGSPTDPTGDVSNDHYVQAVNGTFVAVYDLEGNTVAQFSMQTLWSSVGAQSAGDPIVLFDEIADKWIITEFADPSNILIAVSETSDPLGSYFAYSFSTPNFPDYPHYAITPKALVVTTNEGGAGTLHQYFIDREALIAGEDDVTMQRIAIEGSPNAEQGFIVSSPVDWNGTNLPFDDRPIALKINDSSWAGGPDEDQIELFSFKVDFTNQLNTTVTQTNIVLSPFDSYPCSATGFGFACVPQSGGGGLDAIPEVIMNIPHLRNFGTHESLVFNFVTDVTDGDNLSGIRWVELRRSSADEEWALYQEGTFSPADNKDRFMGSVAMDANGNIGLAYNVTSAEEFVGVRFTGRYASDPLGVMTVEEVKVVEGQGTISSGGRFGDYAQMSVSPNGNTFWYTTEYAGVGNQVTQTRIIAFELGRDSFDLAATAIVEPVSSAILTDSELVTGTISNLGLNSISEYTASLIIDNVVLESKNVDHPLALNETVDVQFDTPVDMSIIGDYKIAIAVSTEIDENSTNDTLRRIIKQLPTLEVMLSASVQTDICEDVITAAFSVRNLGADEITSLTISANVNGVDAEAYSYTEGIESGQIASFAGPVSTGLIIGENDIVFTLSEINGETTDFNPENNSVATISKLLDPSNFITFIFNSDNFPEESSWTIVSNTTGNVVNEGRPTATSTEYREDICVDPDDCFTITVNDSYGDGICCSYGVGNFIVLDKNGDLLLYNGGEFGFEVTNMFCQDPIECLLTATIDIVDASADNVADGSIMINASNGIAPYTYSLNGDPSQENPIFDNLLPGEYIILVTDATGGCTFEDSITVGVISSTFDVDGISVELIVAPNPTDGIFEFQLKNLPSSEKFIEIQIYDVTGRLIQNRIIGKYNDSFIGMFSLLNYPNGTYFLRAVHTKVNILEKIIKR
ncbi:MAG: hypothetical protein ACJA1A_001495 [Saprospiraceae bacterium]|jgi:hypothetical protein